MPHPHPLSCRTPCYRTYSVRGSTWPQYLPLPLECLDPTLSCHRAPHRVALTMTTPTTVGTAYSKSSATVVSSPWAPPAPHPARHEVFAQAVEPSAPVPSQGVTVAVATGATVVVPVAEGLRSGLAIHHGQRARERESEGGTREGETR